MPDQPADSTINVVIADLARHEHRVAIEELTQAYACDSFGNSGPLPREVIETLVDRLAEHPTTLVFLAYIGAKAAGIATCFVGFSTFAAKPLINIHDFAIRPEFRGMGLARRLMEAVEAEARRRGYVKLTLEVLDQNARAKGIYEAAGFSSGVSGHQGGSLFYSKKLT